MFGSQVAFGAGFASTIREAKSNKTQTTVIKGTKIKEKKGKLSKDLGKPAMKATAKELKSYVDNAKSGKEKIARTARVNLMKAHKKGHAAQHHTVPKPQKGKVAAESIIRPAHTLAVIKPKYR